MSDTQAVALSKSQQAYRWLKQRIVTRALTPGYRLVLTSIAAELDISVVPVREAIRQLEAEGLVTYRFNAGARVAMVDVSQYRDTMQALGFLEAAATALSAHALTADDLREARAIHTQMAAQLAHLDPHGFTELNEAFHAVLFRRCPNARLLELVKSEWLRLGGLRDSTFAFVPEHARVSVREHDHLLTLIEHGAAPAAIERAARDHRSATLHAFMARAFPDGAAALPNL